MERISTRAGTSWTGSWVIVAYNTDVREGAKRDRIFEPVGKQVEIAGVHPDPLVSPHPTLDFVQYSVAIRMDLFPERCLPA